jgi:outer membrane usher protein FimD/PapC
MRECDYIQVGYSIGAPGSFSLGHANQRYRGMGRARYATFNWYTRLRRQMAFSLSVNQDIENSHSRSLLATLTFTPAPPKGGLGWSGRLYFNDGEVSGNGRVSHLGRYAGGPANGDYSNGYVGQRGAIVLMGGGV